MAQLMRRSHEQTRSPMCVHLISIIIITISIFIIIIIIDIIINIIF